MKAITMYESINGQRFVDASDACFADFVLLRAQLVQVATFVSVNSDMAQFSALKQASEEIFAKWQEYQKLNNNTPIKHKTASRGILVDKREERKHENQNN